MKSNVCQKIILCLLLGTFVFGGVVIGAQHVSAQTSIFQPFGGTLIYTDYLSCSCGSIVLTIYDKKSKTSISIIYIYVLQLLKEFGLIPDDFPTPTLYEYYNIFTPDVELLGNYLPFPGAPCLQIVPYPPYCSVNEPGAVGYLYQLGTSLIPAF